MDFEQNELKEIWARSDEYFQFRYEEYRTFGGRLKKWRELNDISQMEMAEAIYSYRKLLGLEDDDILLGRLNTSPSTMKLMLSALKKKNAAS